MRQMHVLTISITTSIRIYVGHTKSNEQQFFYKFSVYIFPLFWKFEYSLAVVFCSSCPKTLTHSCLECLVCLVMLASHLILHKTKEMVIRGRQIRTVRRVRENFPPHVLNFSKVKSAVWGQALSCCRMTFLLGRLSRTAFQSLSSVWT